MATRLTRNTILSARNPVTLVFEHAKSTKNTHRYEEQGAPENAQGIVLYLRKTMVADETPPAYITVTIRQ